MDLFGFVGKKIQASKAPLFLSILNVYGWVFSQMTVVLVRPQTRSSS